MRATRTAEQALRLVTSQQYVCHACRLQAARRQFSTSVPRGADVPFYKRIQQSLFGSKEADQAAKSREEKTKKRLEEIAEREVEDTGLEIVKDRKGNEYEVAALVDPSTNKDYVQATNWDGLETVGSVQWVKERADQGEVYHGFLPTKHTELSNSQWELLLHHVLVEVLALQKAGRGLEEVCYPRADSNNSQYTQSATISSRNGGADVTLNFGDAADEQAILRTIPESAPTEQPADSEALFAEVQSAVGVGRLSEGSGKKGFLPPAWMDVSLRDPLLKIAIIKRTLQLTGKRLPDPAISTASTLADLYNAYKLQEQPKKLAQTPQIQKLKVNVPNVSVHSRRQTPIDKEREIGRWKVIEEELIRRDLPVTGSRWQGAKARVD